MVKNLNNQGFLLAEVVVVSVFVLTVFVLIFQNGLPMLSEYKQRIRYDDIDTIYATRLIREVIIHSSDYKTLTDAVDHSGYVEVTCNHLKPNKVEMCKTLFQNLGIYNGIDASFMMDNGTIYNMGHVYITNWNISSQFLERGNLEKGLTDYVQYLRKQNQDLVTDYRILVSRVVVENMEEMADDLSITQTQNIELYYSNIGFVDSISG